MRYMWLLEQTYREREGGSKIGPGVSITVQRSCGHIDHFHAHLSVTVYCWKAAAEITHLGYVSLTHGLVVFEKVVNYSS
jgi:hypothetical protein